MIIGIVTRLLIRIIILIWLVGRSPIAQLSQYCGAQHLSSATGQCFRLRVSEFSCSSTLWLATSRRFKNIHCAPGLPHKIPIEPTPGLMLMEDIAVKFRLFGAGGTEKRQVSFQQAADVVRTAVAPLPLELPVWRVVVWVVVRGNCPDQRVPSCSDRVLAYCPS